MLNGVMTKPDSGVPARDPIASLFARLLAADPATTGVYLDPFTAGMMFSDTAGTIPAVQGGTVARLDAPPGSPVQAQMTQDTGAKHPILRPDGLEYDGVDDALKYAHNPSLVFALSDMTIAVAYLAGASGGYQIFGKRGSNTTPGARPGWGIRQNALHVGLLYDFAGATLPVAYNVAMNSLTPGQWHNIIVEFDYSAATATAYVNDVAFPPAAITLGDITGTLPLHLSSPDTSNFISGRTGRAMAINKVLSAADRAIVNDWLSGGRP